MSRAAGARPAWQEERWPSLGPEPPQPEVMDPILRERAPGDRLATQLFRIYPHPRASVVLLEPSSDPITLPVTSGTSRDLQASGGQLPAPIVHDCELAILLPGTLDSSYHSPLQRASPRPFVLSSSGHCPGGQAAGGRALTVAPGLPGPGRWVPSMQPAPGHPWGEQAGGWAPSHFSIQPSTHSSPFPFPGSATPCTAPADASRDIQGGRLKYKFRLLFPRKGLRVRERATCSPPDSSP